MARKIPGATVLIEGEEYEATISRSVESIRVDSYMPVADPDWKYQDRASHIHSMVDGDYPTLEWQSTPYFCTDCHETHEDGHYLCPKCGEEIRPGTKIPEPVWVKGTEEIEVVVGRVWDDLTSGGLSGSIGGQKGWFYPLWFFSGAGEHGETGFAFVREETVNG